jgi:hypothetical protein
MASASQAAGAGLTGLAAVACAAAQNEVSVAAYRNERQSFLSSCSAETSWFVLSGAPNSLMTGAFNISSAMLYPPRQRDPIVERGGAQR